MVMVTMIIIDDNGDDHVIAMLMVLCGPIHSLCKHFFFVFRTLFFRTTLEISILNFYMYYY